MKRDDEAMPASDAAEPPPKSRIEQENDGARLADDYFSPCCGKRGFRFTCADCASDMGAA